MSDVDSHLGTLLSVIGRYKLEHKQGWVEHFMARLDVDLAFLEANRIASGIVALPNPKYIPTSLATIAKEVAKGKITREAVEAYLKDRSINLVPPTDDRDLAAALRDFKVGFTSEHSSRGMRDRFLEKFMALLDARVLQEHSMSKTDAFTAPLRGLAFEIFGRHTTRDAVLAAFEAAEPARQAS